ncbi:MAG TPA: nucleotidyltransferase domain-containing protein [Campylobacteraceae bacterium]|jgi:predicted nucleotidyltransferase|nr:nucleotidyltransferase domain-containing protein [Campylobacteraceae bacterium]
MKTKKDAIITAIDTLKPQLKEMGIEKIALFGSYVKNQQNSYSDIDIAFQKSRDFFERNSAYDYFDFVKKLRGLLSNKLQREIDLFDLDSASDFKADIEKEMIYV